MIILSQGFSHLISISVAFRTCYLKSIPLSGITALVLAAPTRQRPTENGQFPEQHLPRER